MGKTWLCLCDYKSSAAEVLTRKHYTYASKFTNFVMMESRYDDEPHRNCSDVCRRRMPDQFMRLMFVLKTFIANR